MQLVAQEDLGASRHITLILRALVGRGGRVLHGEAIDVESGEQRPFAGPDGLSRVLGVMLGPAVTQTEAVRRRQETDGEVRPMGVKINWSVNVKVDGGPTSAAAATIDVEAYDPIVVTIPAGAAGVEVDVQPGDANQVQLLLVRANPGPAEGEELTYSVDGGVADIALDAPQLLVGQGMVNLLGAAPRRLAFTSTMTADTEISIFVARTATTPP